MWPMVIGRALGVNFGTTLDISGISTGMKPIPSAFAENSQSNEINDENLLKGDVSKTDALSKRVRRYQVRS